MPEELKADIVDPFDFFSVPELDLSMPEKELLPKLLDASEKIGFMTIVNHGVSLEKWKQMFSKSEEFFSLDQATKDRFKMADQLMTGYYGKGERSSNAVAR